jgi:outer membrane protein OmpA-like peptidoglycan-associated protein
MKNLTLLSSVALILSFTQGLKAQTENAGDCKDHPRFKCLPDFRLNECFAREADTFNFPVESRIADDVRKQTIDGKHYFYSYNIKEDAKQVVPLLIFRDLEYELYENYGTVVARVVEPMNPYSFITGKIPKDNMATWILIQATSSGYQLNIVEKKRKVQVVMANEMWNELDKKDSVALDIFFDDDTITMIPASLPIIDQIYDLMINHPSLKLSIQCHTDNRRPPTDNKIKSAMRAKVVLDAITAKGIDKARLSSIGWGQDKPVADNSTDEGRAKNRRVVIIKRLE